MCGPFRPGTVTLVRKLTFGSWLAQGDTATGTSADAEAGQGQEGALKRPPLSFFLFSLLSLAERIKCLFAV